jgi:hypothetical protein
MVTSTIFGVFKIVVGSGTSQGSSKSHTHTRPCEFFYGERLEEFHERPSVRPAEYFPCVDLPAVEKTESTAPDVKIK